MARIDIFLLAGLIFAAGDVQAGEKLAGPEVRRFGDWLAVCDNLNDCSAFGPSIRDRWGWIKVEADAGPNASPRILLGSDAHMRSDDGAFDPTIVKSGPDRLDIRIDDRTVSSSRVGDLEGGPAAVYRLEAPDMPATLGAIGDANRLSLSGEGPEVVISLAGVREALGWIDDRQGRAGTTVSLIKTGDRPASTIPAAVQTPPAPRASPPFEAESREAQRPPRVLAAHPAMAACLADPDAPLQQGAALEVVRLSADHELWSVPCSTAPSTFYRHRLFLTGENAGDPRLLALDTAYGPTTEPERVEFDPESALLFATTEGEQGSCGLTSLWTWTGKGFVLTREHLAMSACWNVPEAFWPATWRTR